MDDTPSTTLGSNRTESFDFKFGLKLIHMHVETPFMEFVSRQIVSLFSMYRSVSNCGLDNHWLPYVSRCFYCQVQLLNEVIFV
jgi:hypothetical protein